MHGIIGRTLAFIGRHATLMLAGGVFVGVALQDAAAALRPLLPLFIFALTAATMLRIDWPKLIAHARRPGRVALVVGWSLILSPLLVALPALLLPLPPALRQSLILCAAAPPISSAAAFALLLGLDAQLALLVSVVATLLVPLTLPPLALALIGLELDIGVAELSLRLALFIGGAFVLALVLRQLLGARRLEGWAHEVNGINVVLMVLFATAIMDGIPGVVAERPGTALLYTVAAYGLNLGLQALGGFAFLWMGRNQAVTVAVASGNNNLGIVWANLGAAASGDLMLYFAVGQLPIYTLPALLAPLYRTLRKGGEGAAPARPGPGRVDEGKASK